MLLTLTKISGYNKFNNFDYCSSQNFRALVLCKFCFCWKEDFYEKIYVELYGWYFDFINDIFCVSS